jgi:hypothetical protein
VRTIGQDGKEHTQKMHRLILGIADPKLDVDHRDGDGLNNCRSNLRVATRQQNGSNQRKRANSNTYKGVCFDKSRNRWLAGIKVNYKRINLGRFESEIEAAQMYDVAAKELHGEFARLNFPPVPTIEPYMIAAVQGEFNFGACHRDDG